MGNGVAFVLFPTSSLGHFPESSALVAISSIRYDGIGMQLRDPIARNGLSAFLRERRIGDPDGRLLRDYKVTVAEFESLIWYVQSHEHFHWKDRDCGALVLVLSEWTYQHATRLQSFWLDAFQSLGLVVQEPKVFCKRLAEGLAYLKRPSRTPYNWIGTFISEGGFPRRLSVSGLDKLLDRVFSDYSWAFLAAAAGKPRHAMRIAQEILRRKEDPSLAGFAGEEVAPIVTEMVVSFAAYRRDLRSAVRPREQETVEQWVQRIGPEDDPRRSLPLRDVHEAVFADLLFPRLRSGVEAGGYVQHYRDSAQRLEVPHEAIAGWMSDAAVPAVTSRTDSSTTTLTDDAPTSTQIPVSLRVIWPMDQAEPLLEVRVPVDGLPANWIHQLAPTLTGCSRVAVSPAGLPALGETLELAGEYFKSTRKSSWTWPLGEASSRNICVSRRSLKGVTELPMGIAAPNPAIVIADLGGRAINVNDLLENTEYRVWLPRPPRRISANVQRRSETTFHLRGFEGDVATFETDEDTIELSFSSSPLPCDLVGRRWLSNGALGPYLGLPTLHARSRAPMEFRTASASAWQRLQGGPTVYSFPSTSTAGRIRALIRADGRSNEFRFSFVPANTSYRLHPPTTEGMRVLSIVSTGLTRVRVLQDELEVVASAVETSEPKARVLLPPIEERQRYRLELTYGSTVVVAPLWDVRRTFWLDLGGDFIQMTHQQKPAPRIERAIARYASIEAGGLRPEENVDLRVRSINPGRRLDRERFLRAGTADSDGNLRLTLAGIVDDLDPCARHHLSFIVQEDARQFVWRLDIDDTIFAKEPEFDEPYGALAPRSQIRGANLTWGCVPAARQWESIQFAPMIEVAGGRMPPATEIPPGGLLAAPFDGEHRVGYMRHFIGPVLVDDDPLCNALARPGGFDLALLRREFAEGRIHRERLHAILTNLAAFNAGASLTVPTVCSLDGAMLAYAAMRNDSSAIADGSLRAIPVGAWRRAAEAVQSDEGKWVQPMFGCAPEALVLIILLRQTGLAADHSHISQLDHFAEDLMIRRPSKSRAQTDPGEADVHTPATLLDYDRRLPALLDDWRRGDRSALREYPIDPQVKDLGIAHPEVRDYLAYRYQGLEYFFEAPLALATAAARATLDPGLDGSKRRALRTLMCAQQQARAWERLEPLVGALHAFSLCAHWRSLTSNFSDADQARAVVERIEVQ